MKILSFNVNGIRAIAGKNFISDMQAVDADVICLQETKATVEQVKETVAPLNYGFVYANEAERKGYSGTAIISKTEPLSVTYDMGVAEHDKEGRVICAEYSTFYLVTVYVPNSGSELLRLDYRQTWDADFLKYLKVLEAKKPVVVCGDMNVAHKSIDLARPKANYNKSAGHMQEEIDGMDNFLAAGLADTGIPLIEAYGLTETSPAATINPLDLKEYNGAIGLPVSSTVVAIRDDAGNDLPIGEAGEICVFGPQVMRGYYNRPEETAKVIMPDGFLRTGDVGVMDEKGFVRIVDRKKDMILVSGFNVYPNEIEAVVAMHPGVLEVAAVGVPDEKSGEAVKIFIVKKDPALTAEAVIAHCKENLTGYKVPKLVEFRAELPKTNVGKILRRALRDETVAKA